MTAESHPPFTTVIGLEVHVQLQTQTKLFCGCVTTFGSAPNTQVCPTCLGLPGSLPVMNKRAFDLSLRAALARKRLGIGSLHRRGRCDDALLARENTTQAGRVL